MSTHLQTDGEHEENQTKLLNKLQGVVVDERFIGRDDVAEVACDDAHKKHEGSPK